MLSRYKKQSMLRRGDLVEVKSAEEILETIDNGGTLEALPYMPEMIQYCGRRFFVDKRAEKICDTVRSYCSRRMPNTVILEQLRCDGSAHDYCQAECRIFWKEAWLRRVSRYDPPTYLKDNDDEVYALKQITSRFTSQIKQIDGIPIRTYRCQATELYNATTPLRAFDPRPYIREFTSGNITIGHFIHGTMRAYIENLRRKYRKKYWVHLPGNRIGPAAVNGLDLKPGEWVQVKTKEEIAATLTPQGRDRGLWFDREMLRYCGGIFKVRQRVKRFINESTQQMIELNSDCVTLEGVVCSGDHSDYRHFCPRAIYPYWRESWLRRVNLEPPLKMDS